MRKIFYGLLLAFGILRTQDILQVYEGKIHNSFDETINLKGCNLGNWLMLEMWMLNYAEKGISDQYEFINTLEERFGIEETERIMDIYRTNWIRESDFDIIKSFGMNTVRLPFDYKLLMDSNKKPFLLKNDAWEWLDKAIQMAKKRQMYVILDMHGAPGRQSGMDHSGQVGYNKLFTTKIYQEQTVWLWKRISERYKNESVVAAYDILNEPWGGTKNQLKSVIVKCYSTIRENDDQHIVIFPGYYDGIDFYKNIRSVPLNNVIYTAHFYPGFFGWGSPTPYVHAQFLQEGLPTWKEKMISFQSPLLVGEFNVVIKDAGGGEMMRRYYDYFESVNWPATMWSYKVLNNNGGVGEGSWGMITNKNKLIEYDILTSSKLDIIKWFESFSTLDYIIDEDLRYWLTTKNSPTSLSSLPPKPPILLEPVAKDLLPIPWDVKDIGNPLKGGQKIENNSWTVYGGGDDIWNSSDQFRFVYQKIEGDFNFSVKIDSLKDTHYYAKAGIMVRKNLNKNSAHGIINVFPGGNSEFGYRQKTGQMMKAKSGPSLNWSNVRLKVEKTDKSLYFYIQTENELLKVGKLNIKNWGKSIYVGLATLSHDNSQLTTATYSNIQLDD